MSMKIKPVSGYTVMKVTLRDLFDKFDNGEIRPYAVWLQRLKQESKWAAKDWQKARSYLYRLFVSGKSSKSTFTVVKIDLLLQKLNERVVKNSLSKDNIQKSIFEKMIEGLTRMKDINGVKFILLDGQNRLTYSLRKFFKSELQFYFTNPISKNAAQIEFESDDPNSRPILKEQFYYKDLTDDEKTAIDNIQVIFSIGDEGEIDEFIEDLIDDNSGESWNEFERVITSLHTICYYINTSLSQGKDNVPEFKIVFDSVGKLTGDYSFEKKGYNKILWELIQYDKIKTLKVDYEHMLDESKKDKIEKSFQNVKQFFKAIAGKFPIVPPSKGKDATKVFATKEMLRNFYIIIKLLEDGIGGYKLKLAEISNIKELYKEFAKFDAFKRDREKNSKEFTKVNDSANSKGMLPNPNTWTWAQKDIRSEVLDVRRKILTAWINENIEKWIKSQIIVPKRTRSLNENDKTAVKLNTEEDIYSAFGEEIDSFDPDLHVDHLQQFGRDGSDEPDNLTATSYHSNTARVK